MRIHQFLFAVIFIVFSATQIAHAGEVYPAPAEGDFVIEDFAFGSGETMDLNAKPWCCRLRTKRAAMARIRLQRSGRPI